jgi:hypothetical protein
MRRPGAPIFLARRSYRRRRLRDAARLLPVFGMFLFLLPILWAPRTGEPRGTAMDGLYLFGVWGLLVIVAAALAPGLTAESQEDAAPAEDQD